VEGPDLVQRELRLPEVENVRLESLTYLKAKGASPGFRMTVIVRSTLARRKIVQTPILRFTSRRQLGSQSGMTGLGLDMVS
jgi:hypothetical protein